MTETVKHTPGPWRIEDDGDEWHIVGRPTWPAERFGVNGEWDVAIIDDLIEEHPGEASANARLIAAAPDHALICWAMCVGAGRWEAFGDGRGEFCMNGLRHLTKLDEFGCPIVTAGMRAALKKAGSP